jgi:hypothetical protein
MAESDDHQIPQSLQARLIANCRPQPAIPAVLTFFGLVLIPAMVLAPNGGTAWGPVLIVIGILVSGALAIAAGFCSVFPQTVWLVLAAWFLATPASAPVQDLLVFGMITVTIMLAVQIWRVLTGRFVPTIETGQGQPNSIQIHRK